MATWANLGLQNSSSPLIEQLNFFHDHTVLILIIITVIITYVIGILFFNKFTNRYLLHGQTIEIIWTILPAIILIFIAFPSLRLLYLLDEINGLLVSVHDLLDLVISSGDAHPDALSLARDAIDEFIEKHQ